jgi:hypothetical protein
MRLAGLAAVLTAPAFAVAQVTAPITTLPLLPPSAQQASPPPAADQGKTPPVAPPAATRASWLPQGTAELQVLDKVNAQNALLSVKVGQEAQFGSLSIQVQACDIRPPDQPQDAAAFLTIVDSHPDAPGFRGWMLANDPSLSMLQHPIYDVRVVGCKA